jgi:prepilin-type N-terminal cleavage/methylation domain-containing protein
MKRESGFSLVELMVAMAVMLLIVAATVSMLTDAVHAVNAIGLMADTQENMRAGLNYMVRDLSQAGDGIAQTGIGIPAGGVVWPGTGGNFPNTWTALYGISPGYELGPATTTSGQATDLVTMIYADNTLQDNTFAPAHWLNEFPINVAATCPNGSITSSGAAPSLTITIKFDGASCINVFNGNTGLNIGDLILLQNNAASCGGATSGLGSTTCDASDPSSTMALRVVTATTKASNSITLAPGDAFGLNGGALPGGTITATRIWMITYYINNSNSQLPLLMREVNLNGAVAVAQVIENLQLFYDVVESGQQNPPVLAAQGTETPTYAQLPYIRDAYIWLFARSEQPYLQSGQYFRNNFETSVSVRGLDFYNEFK